MYVGLHTQPFVQHYVNLLNICSNLLVHTDSQAELTWKVSLKTLVRGLCIDVHHTHGRVVACMHIRSHAC